MKLTQQRQIMFDSTTPRPVTIQRIRIRVGAGRDRKITVIGPESWSGNLRNLSESATIPTRLMYAGANRVTRLRVAHLNLAEGNAMRAPGGTPGMIALELALDIQMSENAAVLKSPCRSVLPSASVIRTCSPQISETICCCESRSTILAHTCWFESAIR